MWNDDWDGSGLVLHDWLFEGGENSQIHAVKLNRATGADGLVTVAPELVWHAPGWDDQELHDYGNEVSIENSVAVYGNTLYFGNSGGLIQGWNIAPLLDGSGEPQRTFRFWAGADTDGTITVDEHGILYVGAEWEKHLPRSSDVGQMMALDPARGDDNALVWSQHDDGVEQAGVYSSAGITGDLVIFTTYSGRAIGLDRATGAIRWEKHLPGAAHGVARDRGRRVAPGRLRRHHARVRRAQHRWSTRPSSGRCNSAGASRRHPRCGTGASTWAHAAATSTPSPTRRAVTPTQPASTNVVWPRS